MKCELARDLIILYAEELCSQETAEELKAHLENCPECTKRLEEYKKELEEHREQEKSNNQEDSKKMLKPMKKVRKKLARGKAKIATLCLVLVMIIGCLGMLSYGQATNECLSFSVVADAIKLKSVCKALSKGDVQPFMDILAYRLEDNYTVVGAEELEDMEDYRTCVAENVEAACTYYFEGKDVTVKLSGIDQYSYAEEDATDMTKTDFTFGFYENDELLYEMAFGKASADKFIVYEVPKYNEPGLTESMLPYYDTNLDICLHYATRKSYNDLVSGASTKAGGGLALVITKEGTDEEKNDMMYRVIENMQKLCDEGWYFKDVMYFVDEYDRDAGKWIYKVWFMVENQSDGSIVMLEQCFYYHNQQLYVLENTPAIIIATDGDVPTEVQKQLVNIFE